MKKTILIAAVMFFAFSVAAFAQATFQVASTPVTQVASCGTAELTGDIAFTQVVGSLPITTGTITINYGVAVTNYATATYTLIDAGNNIITGPTAIVAAQVKGNLLNIPVVPPGAGVAPYTIRLTGIRVNIAGNSALTSLSATVSSTGNLFVGGQTNVMVIQSIGSALASVDTGAAGGSALTISSVSPATSLGADNDFNVRVTEGFANAWVLNSMVSVTFSTIPTGLTVTVPAGYTTTQGTVFQRADATGAVLATTLTFNAASTVLTAYYKVTTVGATADANVENLILDTDVALTVPGPALPLGQGTLQVASVDMAPRLGPFPDFAGSVVPQYSGTSCQKGPVTVLTIASANTLLLIPYATTAAGYNTGIAIANTTADPLGAGVSAVPQSGKITFTFYPQTGASFTYATGATSPGQGLTSGSLPSGRIYTVLLSELLTAAGAPATFSGYIFANVDSTNAHGQYFISDFAAFTNGALMLVVDPAKRRPVTVPESMDN